MVSGGVENVVWPDCFGKLTVLSEKWPFLVIIIFVGRFEKSILTTVSTSYLYADAGGKRMEAKAFTGVSLLYILSLHL